jgi:hypothetical protein
LFLYSIADGRKPVMARTSSRVNKGAQVKATAAAKRARVEEAGLRGPRLGSISAATRRAQARRDASDDVAPARAAGTARGKSAAAAAAAAAATATATATGTTASSKVASKKPGGADAADAADAAGAAGADSKTRKHRGSPVIEVRTANAVKGSAGLDAFAEKVVTGGLSRFMPRVTRIDVHLSDANAEKQGDDDKRCQIEVRPASQQPVSATATAATIEKALTSAVAKMKRLLAKRLDRRVRA